MTTLTSAEIKAMRAQAMRDGATVFWAIVDAVCAETGVTRKEIASPTRGKAHVVIARDWACRCAYDRGVSMAAIGRLLGRDHSSVSAAIDRTRAVEPTFTFKSRRAR